MKVGEEIRICVNSYSYRGKYSGAVGVIERGDVDKSVGVRLHDYENKASSYGIFWFKNNEIEGNKEDYIMLPNYKVAVIKFMEGTNKDKTYNYAIYEDIMVGTDVVVKTGHHGFALATIVDIRTSTELNVGCGREVVCIADMRNYRARLDTARHMHDLKVSLDKKVLELKPLMEYEVYAKLDPGMAALLAEYNKLVTGGTSE